MEIQHIVYQALSWEGAGFKTSKTLPHKLRNCPSFSQNRWCIPEERLFPVRQAIVHHLLLVKAVLYDGHIFLSTDSFQHRRPVSAGSSKPQPPSLILGVFQCPPSGPRLRLEGVTVDIGLVGGGDGGLEDAWRLRHGVVVDDPED